MLEIMLASLESLILPLLEKLLNLKLSTGEGINTVQGSELEVQVSIYRARDVGSCGLSWTCVYGSGVWISILRNTSIIAAIRDYGMLSPKPYTLDYYLYQTWACLCLGFGSLKNGAAARRLLARRAEMLSQ